MSSKLVDKLRTRMLELRDLMMIAQAANPNGRELIGDAIIHVIIQDVLSAERDGEVGLDINGEILFKRVLAGKEKGR